MTETNLKLRISPEYNFKRIRNTLECCADYLSELDLGGDAWLLDDVRDALARMPAVANEAAAFRNFIEEVAGSCITDYEEAKAEAQDLLAPASGMEARQGGDVKQAPSRSDDSPPGRPNPNSQDR